MTDANVQRFARQLWPRVTRVMHRAKEAQWSQVAALLHPFVLAPTPATYLGVSRMLGAWLRREAMTTSLTSRWQAELDAVREALAHDARFLPLSQGRAHDAHAADRLSALALIVGLRELAEAKGEAAAFEVKRRLQNVVTTRAKTKSRLPTG